MGTGATSQASRCSHAFCISFSRQPIIVKIAANFVSVLRHCLISSQLCLAAELQLDSWYMLSGAHQIVMSVCLSVSVFLCAPSCGD